MRPTSGYVGEIGLSSTQPGQTPGALAFDQGAEGLAHESRLLGCAGESLCFEASTLDRMNDPIRNLGELLDEAGTTTLGELGQTLASVVGVEEPLWITQSGDGTIAVTIGNDSYDIEFPTTWDALIKFLVGIDEGTNGDDSDDGERDSNLLID